MAKHEPVTLPIPTNEEAVAWAEEAERLAVALQNLITVIETDDLIPASLSYMRQAKEAVNGWPNREEVEAATGRIRARLFGAGKP